MSRSGGLGMFSNIRHVLLRIVLPPAGRDFVRFFFNIYIFCCCRCSLLIRQMETAALSKSSTLPAPHTPLMDKCEFYCPTCTLVTQSALAASVYHPFFNFFLFPPGLMRVNQSDAPSMKLWLKWPPSVLCAMTRLWITMRFVIKMFW